MTNELDQFKETYITECFELLETMEEELLDLDEAADMEKLNAIFRCAHSIKGGAGAFNFKEIAEFTHTLEALLDGMREEEIAVSQEAVDVLLRAVDIVSHMVGCAQSGEAIEAGFGDEVAKELNAIINASDLGGGGGDAPASTTPEEEEQQGQPEEILITLYSIDFAPQPQLFASGNEPLAILKGLGSLGEIKTEANIEAVPDLDTIEFDQCYMSWAIDLESESNKEEVAEVFEFVEDDCALDIDVVASYEKLNDIDSASEASAEAPQATKEPTTKTEEKPAAPAASKPDTPASGDGAATTPKAATATSIRVDTDKVDRLVNMVGELVITQAMLEAQTRDLAVDQHQQLLLGVEQLTQHSRELQEAVMSVRMQPVKSVFSRMPRIVRDLSNQLNKNIVLEMSGENTEVDKTVIEQLSDPLTHMIRNSVDHGIETPEVRREKGKPEQGTIKLSADHRGGRIIIEIQDDGNGINRDVVLAKAVEKGLVPENANLEEEEIDNLIFMPGFSTAQCVSNISGRGVGMDVVRRNIEALGGTVHVINNPGQGSLLSVSLPLTLAILDGMIVRVGSENYIIAISSIIETLRPAPGEVRKVADANDVINVRGDFVPVVYLYRILGINNAISDPSKGLVILIENGREKYGLVVDELVGQQQVVIKSLETNSEPVAGLSGATILGDGKVSLIVDTAALPSLSEQHVGVALMEQEEASKAVEEAIDHAKQSDEDADIEEKPVEELELTPNTTPEE